MRTFIQSNLRQTLACGGALLMVALLAAPAHGIHSAKAQRLQTAAIDRFVTEQMAANRIPGLALAILQDGAVRYVQGYGAARRHSYHRADAISHRFVE
jgi:CubicO group peptidase (beta-lactamase class C family)